MLYAVLRSKIHRARVTEAKLYYQGSLSVDQDLMDAADLREHDWVQITSMANGVRWQTYVIPAERGSGTIRANGSAARHFAPGDEVIVLAFGYADERERSEFAPKIVFVDEGNHPLPSTGGSSAEVEPPL